MQNFQRTFPTLANAELVGEEDTRKAATKLSSLLKAGDVLALWGDLGVGKSTLARALIQHLCGADTDVPSPTFTLVQTYDAPDFVLWHMDLYRLDAPDDVFELGIEDAFYDAVSLIEWPDKMGGYLPLNRLDVVMRFDANKGTRTLDLQGDQTWVSRLKEFKL